MPFTNSEQITPILSEIKNMKPKSILDVGCGIGMYGFLCRIYLELYGDDENFLKKLKNYSLKPWGIRIDAIEGFKDYQDFIPTWAYDNVIVDSAIHVLLRIPSKEYDLVLALGILEHFSKDDGITFLNELRRVGKNIILSVPKEWKEQMVPENEFETHRSHWNDKELSSFGFNRFLPHPFVWIAISDHKNEMKNLDEDMCQFIKQPEFHNNVNRFLFKLFQISHNDTKDFIEKLEDGDIHSGAMDKDDLKSLYSGHETSVFEKWALRYRPGSKILAIAMVQVEEGNLFVHNIISKKTYLKQMLQKLENLAFKRGLKSIKIVLPAIYQYELETSGYTLSYSMSHVHCI